MMPWGSAPSIVASCRSTMTYELTNNANLAISTLMGSAKYAGPATGMFVLKSDVDGMAYGSHTDRFRSVYGGRQLDGEFR